MEPEPEVEKVHTKSKKTHVLVRNWKEFTDRAMDLLIQNPTQSKFILKYIPKLHKFVLKVTDGTRLVIRKCSANQLQQVQKFATFAGRAFTNEANKKVEDKKKKKKKR